MIRLAILLLLYVLIDGATTSARGESAPDVRPTTQQQPTPVVQHLISGFCLDCHSGSEPDADLNLETLSSVAVSQNSDAWEEVIRKLRTRQMPPSDMPRPEESMYVSALGSLEQTLDQIAGEHPRPGRTDTFRRLTRNEYHNAIRDLLSLDVDVTLLLPEDEASHGFDNITVGELSPTLLNRYISAAQKISQLAVGRAGKSPGGETFRIPPDLTQEERIEGLPLGTRGGALILYTFPQDGEYEIQIRLARDRDEHVEGLNEPHELELLLDRERVALFTVKPPRGRAKVSDEYDKPTHQNVDRHLKVRVQVVAGPHEIGVTFLKNPSSLLETSRQPLNVHFNMYRHPRLSPAVYQVSVAGPFSQAGPGDTPSRRRIFVCQPTGMEDETDCARQILSTLVRRAYRRPINEADLRKPLELFEETRTLEGFEAGIELALSSVLVNPEFLFRVERDPDDIPPLTAYRISDVELASRLSFFLWSSIPDDELLNLAERGQLRDTQVLEEQTLRMLADERSRAMVDNFAGQWLHLRNLASFTPDGRLFPDFDDNLRQAMRKETELFFESIMREDRSVLDLLRTDYTYLNERLAKHYGIPFVYGSTLPPGRT